MYLDLFKLREFPFRLTPDTDFLYMSSAHARAKAYMDYTVWNREGFVVITGDIGCGKTTLIQKLLSELDGESVLVAKIFQTQLDEVEFLQAVLVEDMLNSFLVESFAQDKQLVLVVDDAHNLSMKALEEIRMLSGLETQKEKILHVILVGQPPLNDLIEAPEMEQLLQRVRLRFHLKPLTEQDTSDYISHRLKVAGTEREDIFAPETIPIIFKYTGGTPRLINTLCDTAMICAYADTLDHITPEVVHAAVEELQWLPYAKRVNAKRGKDRGKSEGDMRASVEQERLIGNISTRLSQLDGLTPALNVMSDRMQSIESLLRELVDALTAGKDGGSARKTAR
jgi:general secretion pathway protein A